MPQIDIKAAKATVFRKEAMATIEKAIHAAQAGSPKRLIEPRLKTLLKSEETFTLTIDESSLSTLKKTLEERFAISVEFDNLEQPVSILERCLSAGSQLSPISVNQYIEHRIKNKKPHSKSKIKLQVIRDEIPAERQGIALIKLIFIREVKNCLRLSNQTQGLSDIDKASILFYAKNILPKMIFNSIQYCRTVELIEDIAYKTFLSLYPSNKTDELKERLGKYSVTLWQPSLWKNIFSRNANVRTRSLADILRERSQAHESVRPVEASVASISYSACQVLLNEEDLLKQAELHHSLFCFLKKGVTLDKTALLDGSPIATLDELNKFLENGLYPIMRYVIESPMEFYIQKHLLGQSEDVLKTGKNCLMGFLFYLYINREHSINDFKSLEHFKALLDQHKVSCAAWIGNDNERIMSLIVEELIKTRENHAIGAKEAPPLAEMAARQLIVTKFLNEDAAIIKFLVQLLQDRLQNSSANAAVVEPTQALEESTFRLSM
jgi:hypothetical protein